METTSARAVLFAKDLTRMTAFYSEALGMVRRVSDEHHAVLECHAFELIVHQIPRDIAEGIRIDSPPVRRVRAAVRLDYPVANIESSRERALSLGGGIDRSPPGWADRDANFFIGFDPEGNQFGVHAHGARVEANAGEVVGT